MSGVHPASQVACIAPVEPEVRNVQRTDHGAGNELVIHLFVPPDLCWFAGHFNEVALLPGVVQTHWVACFAQHYFALPPNLVSMSNMKFMRFIFPGAHIELRLQYRPDRQEVAFEYREGGAISASGRMRFAEAAANQPAGDAQ